ncbi:MAG: ATP synthase F1 subunit delta [Phycisphaerales bacterium]|nr:ATP synthase F1 subunit delta [Phycisphaerales bacterium]
MAELIDKQLAAADGYAAALHELARSAGAAADTLEELDELCRLLVVEPDFALFMNSGALDADQRAAGLEKMLRGRVSDLTLNAVQVLCAHGRNDLLPALRERLRARIGDEARQARVTVRSAVPLEPSQREEISRVAEKLSGRTPVIQFVVQPEILGGLIVEFDDWRFDNSVRRHLQGAARVLEERGKRGFSDN